MRTRSTTHDQPVIAVLTGVGEPLPPGLDRLAENASLRHVSARGELTTALTQADVLVVTDFRTTLLRDAWPTQPRVRWVHATSAGVDAVLFPALVDSDIPVTNARGLFDSAIAEFVLGQILVFAKDFIGGFELKRERRWRHRETERIEGKPVLIVGAGSIGRRIGILLRAVGMHVTALSRTPRQDSKLGAVHGIDSLTTCLGRADYVVIAAPLTRETTGLFDRHAFAAMKRGARLINVARGPIVVTDDLVAALERGQIAGAALDVFEQEPLPSTHPLYSMPNVVLSAHMAGDFIGWQAALSDQFIDNFERWQSGLPLANVVDKRRGYITGAEQPS
jgi:phosphoglycerate dehydrogenase-like enzyme